VIIGGNKIKEELLGLINSSFAYLVKGEIDKSFKCQNEIKNYFNLSNINREM